MPKKEYYKQFEDDDYSEVILENPDQDHPTIINRDAYRMFVGKLIQINTKYYDRIADKNDPDYAKNRLVNYKTPFDIDVFYRMNHRWLSLAHRYYKTEDDPTGLKNISRTDGVHSFEPKHFDLLKDAASDLFYDLADIAEQNNLGTPYTDSQGRTKIDYTEVIDDILELSLLATHAYTDIFNVLEGQMRFGHADEKMQELAKVMHNSGHFDTDNHLSYKGNNHISNTSKMLLNNPNFGIKMWFGGYNEKFYLSRKLDPRFAEYYIKEFAKEEARKNKKTEKTKEEELKEKEELNELMKQIEEEEKQKIDEIDEQIKQEAERTAAEEAEREAAQNEDEKTASLLERYSNETKLITFVPNEDPPSKVNKALYAYFDKFANRMGIDQSKFNAQSLAQAAGIAFLTEYTRNIVEHGNVDPNRQFMADMYNIYKNVARLTYTAYTQKCLNENLPLDYNAASKEVMDLMGVVAYTMYPTVTNGKKIDFLILQDVGNIINGGYGRDGEMYDMIMRADAVNLAKLEYLEKDDSFFTVDAEARFEGFATRKISSTNIVNETASIVDRYNAYKKNRVDPSITDNKRTVFEEANFKKEAMDAAYALERRVETRYGSRLARFFRYFSYAKQRDELARVKEILGIPKEQRVAEHMKSSRIKDLFVETNKKSTSQLKNIRRNDVGGKVVDYLENVINKHLTEEEFPDITEADMNQEINDRMRKYDELTPAAIAFKEKREAEERELEEMRKELERQRKEEEERKRKEEEEKERIRKEEEERKRKEEEERLRKEEEERLRKEEEERIRKEEERKRKEEEKRAYIKRQLQYRTDAIQARQEALKENEERYYDGWLKTLKENKEAADKDYAEKKKDDDDNRLNYQEELEKATARISELEDQIMIQTEQTDSSLSHIDRFYKENEEKIRKRTDELLANKKDKTLQKLLQDKEKEDKENATKKWGVTREHKAGKALEDYLAADPELTSLTLQQQVFRNQKAREKENIADMQHELDVLKQRKPELEKDLNRINHDLEIATKIKEYTDDALKFFTENKDWIQSRYASEELGARLHWEIPYENANITIEPVFKTNLSDLQLESDPKPMEKFIKEYDENYSITEEMKSMTL